MFSYIPNTSGTYSHSYLNVNSFLASDTLIIQSTHIRKSNDAMSDLTVKSNTYPGTRLLDPNGIFRHIE